MQNTTNLCFERLTDKLGFCLKHFFNGNLKTDYLLARDSRFSYVSFYWNEMNLKMKSCSM